VFTLVSSENCIQTPCPDIKCERSHSDILLCALESRSSSLGLRPGRGQCVEVLDKVLYSHSPPAVGV